MLPSLLLALRRVPDHRAANAFHPLASILALAVCAMLCGRTSILAISQWGETYGRRLSKALGFRRPYAPCNSTINNVFRALDVAAFEKALSAWLASTPPTKVRTELEAVLGKEALAVDGKVLRGSHDGEAPAMALVAAFLHRTGQVVDQEKVPQGDELQAVRTVLKRVPLEGRVVTGDALQTQRDVTETILEKGGPTSRRSRAINPRSKRRSPRSSTNSPSPRRR